MSPRYGPVPRPIADRFWEKVDFTGNPLGCWIWLAQRNWQGYGKFQTGTHACKITTMAHRVAWQLQNESIPKDLLVCHKCDNPRCVRPDHLFLGTDKDNMKDAIEKGRWKPHPAGHYLTGAEWHRAHRRQN